MRYRFFLLLSLILCVAWSPLQADDWHFSNVERIVAVGDVHGAYDALLQTLQTADVIDKSHSWSGGKTHLVFTGDLLDRGAKSREVMDLVMRLEKEARRRGGRVHLLLGNHEVMNLNGDLRYVADAEYAAYQDMESRRERENWFRHFLASKPEDSDAAVIRAEFDALAPPGYFGHRKAFRHNGKYGKWLLKKPFIIVINETAFVHGGLPDFVAEYGLEGVNVALKNDLSFYVQTRDELTDQKVVNPVYRFKEIPALLQAMNEAGQIRKRSQEYVQAAIELSKSPLNTPIGPTWYRGTATCSPLVEGPVLAAAFDRIGASRVVMGHTSTVTRHVQQRKGGRTVEIDTGMLSEVYGGSGNALIIEGDRLTVANQYGRKDLSPVEHPVRVGHGTIAVDDDAFARFLSDARLTELQVEGETRRLFEVTDGNLVTIAQFREDQGEDFAPELAAYRLDRLLGLGMVPVTVRRTVDDRPGTLQLVPVDAVSDADLVGIKSGIAAPCSFDKQAVAMQVFDALIDNPTRSPATMFYDPEDLQLILVDHGAAFGKVRPGHSLHTGFTVGEEWRSVLLELDDESLRAGLGDVLDEPRLADLLQRRNTLLGSSSD